MVTKIIGPFLAWVVLCARLAVSAVLFLPCVAWRGARRREVRR